MRQFICDSLPDDKGRIYVSGRNHRYLVKVLRYAEGDMLDARLPDGRLIKLTVEKLLSGEAVLRVAGDAAAEGKTTQGVQAGELAEVLTGPEIWLFQFLPKPQKMDLIVRQAAECGVTRIVPVCGEYSVRNDPSGRVDRWERIVREARQQSGSGVATGVLPVMKPGEAVALWKDEVSRSGVDGDVCGFILDEEPAAGKTCLADAAGKKIRVAAVAVGSEGGMSPEEKELFCQAGFQLLHFRTNVLRTETAALYGIAVIQQTLSSD